jgi:hypothetical protein
MDGSARFQAVLDPGERLLWTGRALRYPVYQMTFIYLVWIVGLGRVLVRALLKMGPLPTLLQVNLAVLAAMFAAASIYSGNKSWKIWNTAYGLTDRRLFMAIGSGREKIRVVTLEALDPVKIVLLARRGKWLRFCLRGTTSMPTEHRPPVWKFLITCQPAEGAGRWHVPTRRVFAK